MTEKDRFIVIAKGNVSPRTRTTALHVLGALGLSTEVMDEAAYLQLRPEVLPAVYPLESIRSREQFVTKEHVLAFRAGYAADIGERMAILGFGTLVMPDTWERRRSGNAVSSDQLGLVVKTREELELPPYPLQATTMDAVEKASRAIQAGSLIDFMEAYPENRLQLQRVLPRFGDNQVEFFNRLAAYLKDQIAGGEIGEAS